MAEWRTEYLEKNPGELSNVSIMTVSMDSFLSGQLSSVFYQSARHPELGALSVIIG